MKEFKKYYVIHANPAIVYRALTTIDELEEWTGEEAIMSTEPGTEFSLWEGSISGKNISFIENKQIIQQWYFGDASGDSIVTIKLHPHNEGTSVELRHSNIPDQDYEDIVEGWNSTYFGLLQEYILMKYAN